MAYSKKIEESIDSLIASWSDVEKKRMFGGVCYLLNSNICFGIINDFLIVRAGVETALEKLREKCSGQVKTDNWLSRFLEIPVLLFKLSRGKISQIRMKAVTVVKHFNVVNDISASLGAG